MEIRVNVGDKVEFSSNKGLKVCRWVLAEEWRNDKEGRERGALFFLFLEGREGIGEFLKQGKWVGGEGGGGGSCKKE